MTTRRFWASLTDVDRRSILGMSMTVVALHVLGFGVLFLMVAPQRYPLGDDGTIYTISLGILAYTFGLRHAFDADHIAAVDNTTRKLMSDYERDANPNKPLSVGFWFSLGHSSIVFALALALSLGVRSLAGQVSNERSGLHAATGLIGASVSGVFLTLLGLVNLAVLIGVLKVFVGMRRGDYDEAELERQLANRGLITRFLGPLIRSVRKPWHIYPVGLLFGLGFDTATEVGLLVLAGGAAALALPIEAILVLPVLFAAGMSLLDSIDGVFMTAAYGWAFDKPVRKVFYNISITSLSVVVALGIGTIELIGVLADQAGITGGPLRTIADIPLDHAGYGIVALFALSWAAAVAVWKIGRIEDRWAPSS